jgi:hypothetical protein
MAFLSCRWTVLELVERFKNLGVCASCASVTAALAELGLELELSGSRAVALARTRDRMDPGAPIRARSASFWRQTAPGKRGQDAFRGNIRPCSWSSSGTAKKEGSPKPGWGEILGLDASSILDDLLSQGLICDPSRELNFGSVRKVQQKKEVMVRGWMTKPQPRIEP